MQTVLMCVNEVNFYITGFQDANKETSFSLIDPFLLRSSKVLHFCQ